MEKLLYGSDTRLPDKRGPWKTDYTVPYTDCAIEDMGWTKEEIENFYYNTAKGILTKVGVPF